GLVVLSACRTGLGKVSGDGILGLTRAFFAAAASSLLATLWDVADEPASYLMPRFYQTLRRSGNKSGSLRAAQLALLRAVRAGAVRIQTLTGSASLPENPIFWASFALLGEP